ncbi:DUF3102 domain-containing protein [Paenibacillus sp. DMB5]|uniref:DUF3102 domain-containing protein n=1 Tax=Paenibacillus sp. DMB5 TaxID=1780103 RepID=UPI00076C980C|nr:DUF3102 domain-containing protein [Paenibacillus sp. DMB5]KUP24900.1 hypothetical protein AWJ19_03160 [Paenibacillus sp. DMB5]
MTQLSIRTVEVIAVEINSIKEQTQRIMLQASVEIGRRLVEAKSMMQHGEWGNWLADTVDYSQSTANNLMRIFEEYGTDQLTLFGDNTNSQALGSLTYTQAVALLGIPAEEREAFAVENNVEDMSTRELQEAVKERKQAIAEREAAEKAKEKAEKAAEKERKAREKLEKQQADHAAIVERLQEQLDAAQAASAAGDDGAAAAAEEAAEQLRASLSKSDEQLIESQRRIKELEEALKAKPVEVATATVTEFVTPPEVLEELELLRKKNGPAAEEIAMFKVHVKSVGSAFTAAMNSVATLRSKSEEDADKCIASLSELVDRLQKSVQLLSRKE